MCCIHELAFTTGSTYCRSPSRARVLSRYHNFIQLMPLQSLPLAHIPTVNIGMPGGRMSSKLYGNSQHKVHHFDGHFATIAALPHDKWDFEQVLQLLDH